MQKLPGRRVELIDVRAIGGRQCAGGYGPVGCDRHRAGVDIRQPERIRSAKRRAGRHIQLVLAGKRQNQNRVIAPILAIGLVEPARRYLRATRPCQ